MRETQKAARDLGRRIDCSSRAEGTVVFVLSGSARGCQWMCGSVAVENACLTPAEYTIQNFLSDRMKLAGFSEFLQIVSLDLKEAPFHRCCAAHPPPQISQPKDHSRSTADWAS
jgi:hypothetical protein